MKNADQSNSPMVTVITPSYNAAKFIALTLQSVRNQTYSNWEMLVVDDASVDDTREIVATTAAADPRIRLISLSRNNGAPAPPRNIGIQEARGKWIAFIDADDIWHPQKLQLQLDAAVKANAEFICSGMQDFQEETSICFGNIREPKISLVTYPQHRVKGRIPLSSALLTSNLAKEHLFNEDPAYKAVEDYHCWLRILRSGNKCIKINAPLLWYRRSFGQISGSKLYMLRRMYMVHRNFSGGTSISAAFFSATHALGGLYYRYFKGKL